MRKISFEKQLERAMFIKYGHEAFTSKDIIKFRYLEKAERTKTKSGNPTSLARLAKRELKDRRR